MSVCVAAGQGTSLEGRAPGLRRVAVIVPVHNAVSAGDSLLERCVDALVNAAPGSGAKTCSLEIDCDIVLVDDASSDASADVAHRIASGSGGRIRLVCLERNLGFAGAVNRGVEAAFAGDHAPDILVLVNQDCIVSPGWLAPLVYALEDPGIAVAGATLFDDDGTTLQHAGARIEANGLTSHLGRGSRDAARWREDRDVDYVCGALFALRSQTWRRFGPFDEGYVPAYFEEVDLCVTVRRAGLRVVYVAASEARHLESSTSGAGSPLFLARYHRSRMRFVVRHLLAGREGLNVSARASFGTSARANLGTSARASVRWLAAELSWLAGLRRWSDLAPVLRAYASLPALLVERMRGGSFARRTLPAPAMVMRTGA